jgi:hypothetical protein
MVNAGDGFAMYIDRAGGGNSWTAQDFGTASLDSTTQTAGKYYWNVQRVGSTISSP